MNTINNSKIRNNYKLVLFDIDGTLIKGGDDTGRRSFVVAIEKVFGHQVVIDWQKHDGSTERKIATDLLKQKGVSSKDILLKIDQLMRARADWFAKNVSSDYKNQLISDAVVLINKLKEKNIFFGLLTGNSRQASFIKLKLVGIDKFFDFGLFGEMAEDRNKLAKLVFAKAKDYFEISFLKKNIFVIGDTIHDIICGQKAGVKTIGVTTGFFSQDDLAKAKPDLLTASLADKKVLDFILS